QAYLGADCGWYSEADTGETTRGDVLLRPIYRKLVEDLVLRVAGVGNDHSIAWQYLACLEKHLGYAHRRVVAGPQRMQVLFPLRLQLLQAQELRIAGVVLGRCSLTQACQQGVQDGTGIAHDTDFSWVVLADLEAIDVDLNQLGFRNIEGHTWTIRRGD